MQLVLILLTENKCLFSVNHAEAVIVIYTQNSM